MSVRVIERLAGTVDVRKHRESVRRGVATVVNTPKLLAGVVILTPIVVASLLGPHIVPHDPTATNPAVAYQGPGGEYILGTDHLGRDLLSRVIIGGRTSLFFSVAAVALALAVGVPLGLVSGYAKGSVDEFIMRTMDIMISLPTLLLGLLILTVLPSNIWNLILAIGIVYIPRIARVSRAATLSVSTEEFVTAAEARAESNAHILFREIFPNILSPIAVEASVRLGFALLLGTSLSFLGLGTQPPNPDWGFMIATARPYIWQTPWFVLWPSLALIALIFGFNMLGDGLRDALDVKSVDPA